MFYTNSRIKWVNIYKKKFKHSEWNDNRNSIRSYLGLFQYNKCPDIEKLKEDGANFGGSIIYGKNAYGVDLAFLGDINNIEYFGLTLSKGIGFGKGWEMHGEMSYTWDCHINLFDLWDSFYKDYYRNCCEAVK